MWATIEIKYVKLFNFHCLVLGDRYSHLMAEQGDTTHKST